MAPKDCLCAMATLAMLAAVDVNADTYTVLKGRVEIDKDYVDGDYVGEIGRYNSTGYDTVIYQSGHDVGIYGGHRPVGFPGAVAAYLLESGNLFVQSGITWRPRADYNHFRQTGGWLFCGTGLWRPADDNNSDTLPGDFVFGGSSVSTNLFMYNAERQYYNSFNLAVMDHARVITGWIGKAGGMPEYKRIIAVNGGELSHAMYHGMQTNTFFAFNGGKLSNYSVEYEYNSLFGNFDNNIRADGVLTANVRIYERGGCAGYNFGGYSSGHYAAMPPLLAPKGNVLQSVILTDAVRNNNGAGWDFVPAVVIRDFFGDGSNAVAVVDYDYAAREITNITVICRGENYSGTPGAVTAELRYKATGEPLATLACEVGECESGGFTFGGGEYSYTMRTLSATNTYRGTTVIDMDPDDKISKEPASENDYRGGVLRVDAYGEFSNSTNLVMRSGLLYVIGNNSDDRRHIGRAFPSCRRLELYGGYLAAYGSWTAYFSLDTVVVGGAMHLQLRRSTNIDLGARIAVTNTLCVDAKCMESGVTPALISTDTPETETSKCGRIKFDTGSKVTVMNWESIPRGRWMTLLDLSSVWVNRAAYSGSGSVPGKQTGTAVPDIEIPEEAKDDLFLRWELDARGDPIRLLARRPSNGMVLIFR